MIDSLLFILPLLIGGTYLAQRCVGVDPLAALGYAFLSPGIVAGAWFIDILFRCAA